MEQRFQQEQVLVLAQALVRAEVLAQAWVAVLVGQEQVLALVELAGVAGACGRD